MKGNTMQFINSTLFEHKPWLILGEEPKVEPDTKTEPDTKIEPDNGVKFNEEQQAYLNKLLAEERRKTQATAQKTAQEAITELEALKARSTLNANEKQELENRIQTLQNTLMTKEEVAAREKERLQKEKQQEIATLAAERDSWKDKFTSATIERSILDAAAQYEAYNSRQLVGLLRGATQLVEKLNEDGSPSGTLEPVVQYDDLDKDGRPIVLTLSVGDAVKRMSESDEWANLFKGKGVGGTGQGGNASGRVNVEAAKRDPKLYRELRKAGQI